MLDQVHANTRRTALMLLAGFVAVALALGYWQVLRAQDLAVTASNPRVADAQAYEPRDRILDRNGAVLASSDAGPAGMVRHNADPSMVHTLGFHSARFGDTNLEAVYNAALRGQPPVDPVTQLQRQLLNEGPTPGGQVR